MTVFWRYADTLSSLSAKFTIFVVVQYCLCDVDGFMEEFFAVNRVLKVNSINSCNIWLSY